MGQTKNTMIYHLTDSHYREAEYRRRMEAEEMEYFFINNHKQKQSCTQLKEQ
jgi:hypothetical protein